MNSKNGIIKYATAMFDIVVLLFSYVLANKVKFGYWRTGIRNMANSYMNLYMIFLAAYFIMLLLFFAYDSIVERNALQELVAIIKLLAGMVAITTFYIYITKTNDYYSRMQMAYFIGFSVVFLWIERCALRRYITKSYHRSGANEKIMLITTSDCVEDVIRQIKQTRNWYFRISNIAVLDRDMTGEVVDKIEVVANRQNLEQVISTEEIDSVFLHLPDGFGFPYRRFIEEVQQMGKGVHWNINQYEEVIGARRIQFLGRFAVVTWNTKTYRVRYLAMKRAFDIAAGAVGTVLFLFVYPFAALGHFLERDAGHTILSYVRVGKGGRRYYQYRFRTLRRDGSKMSVTGGVLKRFGLTALPEMWNVLWGDMSLVGTVSPSLPKYLKYTKNHRRALLVKPGIIWYWPAYFWEQVQEGRCSVEECEEEYVEHWNVVLDFKILIRTLELFFTNARYRKTLHTMNKADYKEELLMLRVLKEDERPLVYTGVENGRRASSEKPVYRFVKRTFDIFASAISLIVLSPVFLALAVAIRWDDGESVFYKQLRIGQNGKKLYIYKFRTMKARVGDLEKILTPEQLRQYEKEFKIENDPRITRIGNFLRKTSLDELPQLLNILKGELSLVGPRPIVEKETEIYGEELVHFLSAKPGLTGYWQAYARNHASYESGERQAMELYYVDHRSLWLDLKIIVKTFGSVIKQDGAM